MCCALVVGTTRAPLPEIPMPCCSWAKYIISKVSQLKPLPDYNNCNELCWTYSLGPQIYPL